VTTVRAIDLDKKIDEIAALPVCAVVGDEAVLLERSVQKLEAAAAPQDQPGSTVKLYEDEAPSAGIRRAAHAAFPGHAGAAGRGSAQGQGVP
jgi:DNA polymerase III delta subunit